MNIRFLPEARDEIDEGFAFYERRCPGLGSEFVDEVQDCVIRIHADPLRWEKWQGQTRRCLVHRFPYAVVYRVSPRRASHCRSRAAKSST